MKLIRFVLLGTICSACTSRPPQDCEVAIKQGETCMNQHSGQGERAMLLACFPFSEPTRISGAWVQGFETNKFFEGRHGSSELMAATQPAPYLETELRVPNDGQLRVIQLALVGRRSRCQLAKDNVIVADRILAADVKARSR